MRLLILGVVMLINGMAGPLFAEVVSREGEGFLEIVEGQTILHLKGSAYERGYQHGRLLKDQIALNISKFIDKEHPETEERHSRFKPHISRLLLHTPGHFHEEMEGLAEGSGISLKKIIALNLFPEMFHCTGLTVQGEATKDGELYHVRVLDYSVGKSLQDTATVMVVEPEGRQAYLNVSYAGFIGCVTGMNEQKISLGEIGGLGYGQWEGMPMAFLMREVLEKASTLEEAKQIFAETPRTCEYYYVIADGKSETSCGIYATASQIHFIAPGAPYALLSPEHLPKNYGEWGENDKFFMSDYDIERYSSQMVVRSPEDNKIIALFNLQPKYCLAVTGFSHPERYPLLMERLVAHFGNLEISSLQEIIKCPVARDSNLHNAIFLPSQLKVWISHAGPQDEPACDQPYTCFSLPELLNAKK